MQRKMREAAPRPVDGGWPYWTCNFRDCLTYKSNCVNEWLKQLSRPQIGLVGGLAGYFLGILSGPVVRLVLAIAILVIVGIVGRSIESQFEARLGFTGVIAAILAVASLGPIQRWMSDLLGDVLTGVSRLALMLVGIFLALHLHQAALAQSDDED